MSVVIHEVSHGCAAGLLGDPTAKLAGRLTLNPVRHIDPFGSVILPLIFALLPGGIIFGWAKPVPFNPYNLKGGKWGPALVALAGPASNLLIAAIFGLSLRFGLTAGLISPLAGQFIALIVMMNLVLAIFNLIPIPPLDGSKILFAALPYNLRHIEDAVMRYQLLLIILVIYFAGYILSPIAGTLFYLLVGDTALLGLR